MTTALRESGLLRKFNEAGVLGLGDVHVARRLAALGGESSDLVLFAAALTVRAVRQGSVCLDLRRLAEVSVDDETDVSDLPWPEVDDVIAAVRRSPLAQPGDLGPLVPLRIIDTPDGELLYLAKYFEQEQTIRRVLDERKESSPDVDEAQLQRDLDVVFPAGGSDRQRDAAELASRRWTSVIAGGPGTGKTHAVARALSILLKQRGPDLRIGLAAPTGKAAARLQESVHGQAATLDLPELSAQTLHRMLGWRRDGFVHSAFNRLPYDVVVVDETSMVPLTMMCRLFEAMRPDARLIIVGDPDQLASVDAGAVLADLVARPGTDVVHLTEGHRFNATIGALANAVRIGDADTAMELLSAGHAELSLRSYDDVDELRTQVVESSREVTRAAVSGDVVAALDALDGHRLLCAHRDGPHGVSHWQRQVAQWVGAPLSFEWYPGQPLLVTGNDYESKLYNGDSGVIVDRDGMVAAFQRGDDPLLVRPTRLVDVQTVYAMTIHRSQGSQYRDVSIVLPGEQSSLLTRELLYTAITRARDHVRLVGSEESLRAGIARQVRRASGLRRP